MNQRGILIRLIDVGLIILLGFVSISDITVRAQIKLPSPKTEENQEQEPELIVYYIIIHRDNRVSLLDQKHQPTDYTKITLETLNKELPLLRDRLAKKSKQLVVLIDPEMDATMQGLIDVLDICQRHRILKNIANATLEL